VMFCAWIYLDKENTRFRKHNDEITTKYEYMEEAVCMEVVETNGEIKEYYEKKDFLETMHKWWCCIALNNLPEEPEKKDEKLKKFVPYEELERKEQEKYEMLYDIFEKVLRTIREPYFRGNRGRLQTVYFIDEDMEMINERLLNVTQGMYD
jgi:ADP-ribose pyrophosphatase YjhB (NUDIX family)